MVSLFKRLIGSAGNVTAGNVTATANDRPSPTLPTPATFTAEQDAAIAAAREWGYFNGAIKTRRDLWAGRRILDIGMGAGPHALSFIHGGAKGYVGVDPHVGTDHVRDFRSQRDPSFPGYHAFPFGMAEIMRLFPTVHLYSGLLESVADQVKTHKVDIAMMAAVTEHLHRPHDVVRAIWDILEPGGHLWISHCNYYSWTGHHRLPRSVKQWDRTNAEQAKHVDWQHLEPTHPDYSNRNFNRVRLDDLKAVVDEYFEIVEWKVSVEAFDRLTPELRTKWRKYTLAELLGQNVYITGRRRDAPRKRSLPLDHLYHPDASYLADVDHTNEDLAPFGLANSVFFSKLGELCSHTDNALAGLRVFAKLKQGDKINVQKFTHRMTYTVAEILTPKGSDPRLKLVEPVPETILNGNHDQWSMVDFGPRYHVLDEQLGAVGGALPLIVGAGTSAAAIGMPEPIPLVAIKDDGQPRPNLDLAKSTLRAIGRYASDMADVRYMLKLADAIGDDAYAALQARHRSTIDNAVRADGNQKYIDIPYWTAHKLPMAKKLGLTSGPPKALLDLGTGAAHILRIAVDHGHSAVGIDIEEATYADIARLLGVDRRVHRVDRQTKLPDFGRKFDIVSSIWIKYDDMSVGDDLHYWENADWAFQFNDIVDNHLKYPGRIHFVLNAQRRASGKYVLDQDALSWMQSQGAAIDRVSGEVDMQLSKPRRFKA